MCKDTFGSQYKTNLNQKLYYKEALHVLKLPFRSQFINFLKNILRNYHTFSITNEFDKGISVEFKRNGNTTLVFLQYFQIACKY